MCFGWHAWWGEIIFNVFLEIINFNNILEQLLNTLWPTCTNPLTACLPVMTNYENVNVKHARNFMNTALAPGVTFNPTLMTYVTLSCLLPYDITLKFYRLDHYHTSAKLGPIELHYLNLVTAVQYDRLNIWGHIWDFIFPRKGKWRSWNTTKKETGSKTKA